MVASLTPSSRATSFTVWPASTRFSTPIICSSVCLPFFISKLPFFGELLNYDWRRFSKAGHILLPNIRKKEQHQQGAAARGHVSVNDCVSNWRDRTALLGSGWLDPFTKIHPATDAGVGSANGARARCEDIGRKNSGSQRGLLLQLIRFSRG